MDAMHEYPEYFDHNKINEPYSSSSEELFDYLKLLDMVAESLLERKGLHTVKKLFTRGLVITESELKSLYDIPPVIREKDRYDPLLCEMVRTAFDYIDSRYEAEEGDEIEGGSLPKLVIRHVRQTFGLDRQEIFAVILGLSVCVDRNYERIFGFLQDDIGARFPTTGLYYTMVKRFTYPKEDEEFFTGQLGDRLKKFFFPEPDEPGLSSPLILNPLMRSILTGNYKSGMSIAQAGDVYDEDKDIPVFFEGEEELFIRELSLQEQRLLYIESDDEKTALHLMYKALLGGDTPLFVLDLSRYARLGETQRQTASMSLRIWSGLLGGRIAVLYKKPEEVADPKSFDVLEEIIGDADLDKVFIFGDKQVPGELSGRGVAVLNVPAPSASLRCRMWEYFLFNNDEFTAGEDLQIADLSDCYEIGYGSIMNICTQTKAIARLLGSDVITRNMCMEALTKQSRVNFSSLASHVNTVYGWDDLKITPDQEEVLRTACNRYRIKNRLGEKWGLKKKNAYGNGVSVLLYGPPGTGKTMAAQVVARELSLPLYRVDISRIFSKYIGETEKNLSSIFDAAKGANVILFFDEADALFSKRTEISGSNDKYSNSETAFLLQKIEEYDGMSILATNYYQNFDNAFIRRITYAVNLKSPDEEQRFQLWSSILPKEAEIDKDLDYRLLANQFDLSGSNIKAILYSAAYMAGAEGKPISMRHVAKAMQYEYQKLGRLVNSSELGPLMVYLM
jgi:hypothetical protein